MGIQFQKRRKGASEELLRELEVNLEAPLPADFRAFMSEQDGGIPEPNQFVIPGGTGASGVNEFLSARQIMRERKELGNRLPSSLLPIAYAEGGNLICLNLLEGSVFYWDHELEATNPSIHLSPAFAAFWDSLNKFSVEDIVLRPGQVKSVWVDPELRKKMK